MLKLFCCLLAFERANTYNEVCHTSNKSNKDSVLSADVGPPKTKIINRSKCNMSIHIIIGGYIIKIEILFT